MGWQQTKLEQVWTSFHQTAKVIPFRQKLPINHSLRDSQLGFYSNLWVKNWFLDRVRNILMWINTEVQNEVDSVRRHYAELMISWEFHEAADSAKKVIELFNSRILWIDWPKKYVKEFKEKLEKASRLSSSQAINNLRKNTIKDLKNPL